MRLFEPKVVPKLKLLPLAAAYVGYIVLCNLNLNINPVGFYQITKIAGGCCRQLPAGRRRQSGMSRPQSFRTLPLPTTQAVSDCVSTPPGVVARPVSRPKPSHSHARASAPPRHRASSPPPPASLLHAVAPAVLAIDYLYYGRKASPRVTASVLVVCLGVGLATVTDPQISSNLAGLAAGFGSVAATALYQIWAGSKQKELGLGSMQLLHQYVPLAAGLLALLVPLCEPMGWAGAPPGSLLGYHYTPGAVVAITISSVLGLLVNLSTFLVSAAGCAGSCWLSAL